VDPFGFGEVKSAFCKTCGSHDEKEKAAKEHRTHVVLREEVLVKSSTVLRWNRFF
jgi:hypothetical protein